MTTATAQRVTCPTFAVSLTIHPSPGTHALEYTAWELLPAQDANLYPKSSSLAGQWWSATIDGIDNLIAMHPDGRRRMIEIDAIRPPADFPTMTGKTWRTMTETDRRLMQQWRAAQTWRAIAAITAAYPDAIAGADPSFTGATLTIETSARKIYEITPQIKIGQIPFPVR